MIFGSRKGNVVTDTILILVVIFAFSITIFVGYKMFGDLNTDLQNDPDIGQTAKDTSQGLYDRYPAFFDGLFLFLLMLVWALIIVASFLIDDHPVFFIFALILFIFVLFVTISLGNTFEEFTTDAEYTASRASFPIMIWTYDHLLQIVIAMGVSVLIALYGKAKLAG